MPQHGTYPERGKRSPPTAGYWVIGLSKYPTLRGLSFTQRMSRRVFVSYATEDLGSVNTLVQHLEMISMHTIWAPPKRSGDSSWWSHLCECVRTSDVILFAQTGTSLASNVCSAEVAYAASLGKPVLAVKLQEASTMTAWAAHLPMVDFRVATPQVTAHLADLLHDAPVVALPAVLPSEPAVPGTSAIAATQPGPVSLVAAVAPAARSAAGRQQSSVPIAARPAQVPLGVEDLKPVAMFDTDDTPAPAPLLGPAYTAYRDRLVPLLGIRRARPGSVPGGRRTMLSRNRFAEKKIEVASRWLWTFTALNIGLGAVLVTNVLPKFSDEPIGQLVILAGALYGLFALLVARRSRLALFASSLLLLLDGLAALKAVGSLNEFAFLIVGPLLVGKLMGVFALSGAMNAAKDLSVRHKLVI